MSNQEQPVQVAERDQEVGNAPITQDQAEFLGKGPVELVQMPDGSVATSDEVARMRADDQEVNVPKRG